MTPPTMPGLGSARGESTDGLFAGMARCPSVDGSSCRHRKSRVQALPICLMLAAMRERNPEVVENLARAGEALLSAARSMLMDHEHQWVSGRQPDFERIDIDE